MLTDSKLLSSAAWDAQSLNELKTKAGQDPQANLRPVARQVEGMFVQMMLKSMRETLPKVFVSWADSFGSRSTRPNPFGWQRPTSPFPVNVGRTGASTPTP